MSLSRDSADLSAQAPASMRVLLIEDSPTIRKYLKAWLSTELPQAEVLEAEDGKTGFRELGRQSVQLIITDLNMPGMDGLTFLEKLRSNSILKRKPVLVLSGSLTEELRHAAALDPLLCLLPKPASIPQLSSALQGLLALAGRPAAPANL